MRRGEVWWAEVAATGERRPVVLLSRDEAYAVRSVVIVAPITTRVRHVPSEVPLGKDDGIPRKCVANLDYITTIPKGCLQERLAALSPEKLEDIENALQFALGLG